MNLKAMFTRLKRWILKAKNKKRRKKDESRKELKTMDNIVFGLACLTLTIIGGIAIYGAALNSAI